MLKIKYSELEWEDDHCEYGAIFKANKFSGIAYHEDEEGYCEYSFEKGLRHGRHFGLDKSTNNLNWEEFYSDDIAIGTHFGWRHYETRKHIKTFENGKIIIAKIEDKYGRLLFKFDRKNKELIYWNDKGIKYAHKKLIDGDNVYQFTEERFWNENGEWLMTVTNKTEYEFNTPYLMEKTSELETEEHGRIIQEFSKFLISNNKKLALFYLHKLTFHKTPFFRYYAAYHLSEINDESSIPFLKNLLEEHIQPERESIIDWQDIGHEIRAGCSIAEMASKTLKNINSKF